MTEQAKKPDVEKDQDKSEFFHQMKDGTEALLSISIPSEGMGWTEMKRNLEGMKKALGLGRGRK